MGRPAAAQHLMNDLQVTAAALLPGQALQWVVLQYVEESWIDVGPEGRLAVADLPAAQQVLQGLTADAAQPRFRWQAAPGGQAVGFELVVSDVFAEATPAVKPGAWHLL